MEMRMPSPDPFVRALIVALMLTALFMPWMQPAQAHAIVIEDDESLDLPAVALTPADLEQVGLTGFGIATVDVASSGWRSLGDAAEDSIAANSLGDVTVLSRLDYELAQTGWQRQYRRILAQPDDANPERVNLAVYSEVAEFSDESGAGEALTLLMDGGQSIELDSSPIGDRTEIRRDELLDSGSRLVIVFQDGDLLGMVKVIQFGGTGDPALEPALLLANRLEERIDDAVTNPQPGLSGMTLHLTTVSSPSEYETYWRWDGEDYTDFGETPEHLANFSAAMDPALTVYQLQFRPVGPNEYLLPQFDVRVLHFEDDEAAVNWLDGVPARVVEDIANQGGVFSAEIIDGATSIGDESLTYAYGDGHHGMTMLGYRIYLRVGADVARLQFEALWPPDLASVEALASKQVSCFQEQHCDGPVQLPEPLLAQTCPPPSSSDAPAETSAPETSGQTAAPATSWQVDAVGENLSGPAASDGLLAFASSQIDPGMLELFNLYAVDAASGAPSWCVTTGEIAGEVVAADGLVFAMAKEVPGGDKQPFVVALDAETGIEQWRFATGWPVDGYVGKLTVADGAVYVSTGLGALFALDAATGDPRWMFEIDPDAGFDQMALSTPAVANDEVYVASGRTLYAVDAATGDLRWQYDAESEDELLGPPAVSAGLVYSGGLHALYAVDAERGESAWEFPVESAGIGRLAVDDGVLFFSSGSAAEPTEPSSIYALDAATGNQLWQMDSDGNLSAPVVGDGVVYAGVGSVTDEPGALVALSAADGQPLWSYPIEADTITPVIVDGLVYAGSELDGAGVAVRSLTTDVAAAATTADARHQR